MGGLIESLQHDTGNGKPPNNPEDRPTVGTTKNAKGQRGIRTGDKNEDRGMLDDPETMLDLANWQPMVERRGKIEKDHGRTEDAGADKESGIPVPYCLGDKKRCSDQGGNHPHTVADAVGDLFALRLDTLRVRKDCLHVSSTAIVTKGNFSALFLTLTNPMAILSFIAIFAGMGLGRMGTDHMAALCLIAGVFSGSMAWWTFLSLITSLFSSRLNAKAMAWINRLSGTVLISFGLLAMSERL